MIGLLDHPFLRNHQLFCSQFKRQSLTLDDDSICVFEDALKLMNCFETVNFRNDCDFLVMSDQCPDFLKVFGRQNSWDANKIEFVFQSDLLNVNYIIMGQHR